MPKASNTVFHCVDTCLAAVLSKHEEANDPVSVLTLYQFSLQVELCVIVFLPSFSVLFFFSSFVLCLWPQGLGLLVLCEQRIFLFVWPQGRGLLVLCEQHIGLPLPCLLRGQAQSSGSLHRVAGPVVV